MESTYVSIDGGLDKENVVHIHHGILRSHKKDRDEIMSFEATWAAEDHDPKPTNAETENQILHVVIYKWELDISYT